MKSRGNDGGKLPTVNSLSRGGGRPQNFKIGSQLDEDSISTMKISKANPYLTGVVGFGSQVTGSIDDGAYISKKPDATKASQFASPRAKQAIMRSKPANNNNHNSGKKKNEIDDLYHSLRALAQSNMESASTRTNKFGYPMTLMESLTNSAIKELVGHNHSTDDDSRYLLSMYPCINVSIYAYMYLFISCPSSSY